MHIEWLGMPAPKLDIPEGYDRLEVEVAAPEDRGPDLRDSLFAAAQMLGAKLVQSGASPGHIQTLTILAPSPAEFEADLAELGLRFREALGGNMGRVALTSAEGPLRLKACAHVPPMNTAPVFGGYTTAEINGQYSPRSTVPEAGDIMAGWRIAGTEYQRSRTAELVIDQARCSSADIYLPDDVENPPLHVFIHGGYWQALNKRDNSHLCDSLRRSGIAVACVDYPLAPPAKIDDIITVCREVLIDLFKNPAGLNYDSNRITISGHSAGGHLVAAMAATEWEDLCKGVPKDLIKGVVAISGLFDLLPLTFTGLNNALRMSVEEAEHLSPIHKPIQSTGRYIAAVGGVESDEFKRQSREFSDRKSKEGTEVEYLELPGLNHFTVVEAMNDPTSALFQSVLDIAKT